MRIIAGSAGGARLRAPKGAATRPTTDRVRESLFSFLVSWAGAGDRPAERQLQGLTVLDLFSGSGAVALEAASRGASNVIAVERHHQTARLIKVNAASLALQVDVRCAEAAQVVRDVRTVDVVFADPPYDLPTSAVEALLEQLAAPGVLAGSALVIVERSNRQSQPLWPALFTDHWDRRYGETILYFGTTPRQPS